VDVFRRQHDTVIAAYPGLAGSRLIHEILRRMINAVVVGLIRTTQANLASAKPKSIDDVRARAKPLVVLSDSARAEHLELKEFLRDRVYQHYKVLRMTSKARRVLTQLFEAFFDDVNLMPTEHRNAAHRAQHDKGDSGRARAVADYIAGMTDRYAIVEHERLFDPAKRS
jgi:dGTPase